MSGNDPGDNRPENMPAIEAPRPPRNLQDLLRFAVEVGEAPGPSNGALAPLDPERRRFLEEALKSMTVDVAKELSAAVNILKNLQNPDSTEHSESDYEDALDKIADFVDHIDAANDFFKLGGFEVVRACLSSPCPGIRWKMADILAQCCQNNPFCQTQAVSSKFLQPLLTMVDQDNDVTCKVKAFFAVASIVRDCPTALKQFIDLDGFSVVLRAMQSPHEKLRVKSTFFMSTMISKNPEIKETLFKMGFIEQLISLIRGEHTSNHEHLISALLSLIEDYVEAQAECRRPEFQLRPVLQSLLDEHSHNEMYLEEVSYIKNLMRQVFTDDHEEER